MERRCAGGALPASTRERDAPVRGERYGYTAGLDSSGDIIVNSDGTVRRKYDEAAVVQDLKVILLSYVGDDIFRPELGVDVLAAVGRGLHSDLESAAAAMCGGASSFRPRMDRDTRAARLARYAKALAAT